MEIKMYKTHPKKFNSNCLNYLKLLRELMEEMKLGEVAVIEKKDWGKTDPSHMYKTPITYKPITEEKYTFSGRSDKKHYYIKKVINPIRNRNDWIDNNKTGFKIVKIKSNLN